VALVVGDADLVRIGPGAINVAPYGTALPTTIGGALDAAFRQVGFTIEGSALTYSQSSDGVEVAERLRPIKTIITGVDMTYEFTMAELSPENLALAMNAPDTAIVTTATETTFTWPKSGGTSRVSIVWQSDDDLERLVLAKCFAGGDITIPRRKGVDPAAVGLTLTVEENAGGDDAYMIWDVDLLAP
jgi:hypothetical protein